MSSAFSRELSTVTYKYINPSYLNVISVKSEAYLVGTNEAQAQGGQHLNDSRAAVALDRVVGLQLWHYALPAHMLPHQGTEVPRHERTLLHLGAQEYVTSVKSLQ